MKIFWYWKENERRYHWTDLEDGRELRHALELLRKDLHLLSLLLQLLLPGLGGGLGEGHYHVPLGSQFTREVKKSAVQTVVLCAD
jgi:hypothetical protein